MTLQALVVGLTIMSVVYIAASLFPILEVEAEPDENPYVTIPFHDSLYFVIITITTVGFGDITPTTTVARLAVLLMLTSTFILLPWQTSKFIEILSSRDPFGATYIGTFSQFAKQPKLHASYTLRFPPPPQLL